ncbi:MAG TPA: hypothetical protein PK264_05350, partial [Hyphomicrobiaceae bacterium]|nr:hypothetical protein [Hyphomicrobiaceae bacterium]
KHDYKMDWADGVVAVEDHAVALSLAGRAHVSVVLGLRPAMKRSFAWLPAPLRRAAGHLLGR